MDEKTLITITLLQTQTVVIATTQIPHINISDQVTKKKERKKSDYNKVGGTNF